MQRLRLEPGMVISMEPTSTMPEGMPGAGRHPEHDILVVTEGSSRNVTGSPYGPQRKIIAQGVPGEARGSDCGGAAAGAWRRGTERRD